MSKANTIEDYLSRTIPRQRTIKTYLTYISYFEKWADDNLIDINSLRTVDILLYKQDCLKSGKTPAYTKQLIYAVKLSYDYKLYQKIRKDNPVKESVKEGLISTKKVPDYLDKVSLDNIPASIDISGGLVFRNRLMLSLIINHAADTEILSNIKLEDINFKKKTIRFTAQARSNERVLPLDIYQMELLHNYLEIERAELPQKESDKLFISAGGSLHFKNAVATFLTQLKKQFPEVKNLKQIRASVISYWIKEHGLMEAMYMAGHRYVSSTEKYSQIKMEQLAKQLDKMHPLNGLV